MLDFSLHMLEDGNARNGSIALKSLEICLESLEEHRAGQSRKQAHALNMPCQKNIFMFHSDSLTLPQALLALQRVERLLITMEDEFVAGECSDTYVTNWGENLSHLIHALGVLLKYVSNFPVPVLLPMPSSALY